MRSRSEYIITKEEVYGYAKSLAASFTPMKNKASNMNNDYAALTLVPLRENPT
ncbi:MAG: hypothetical protein GXP26_12775 [Planctomycetes bacterium]|nr:hypothetical protein [Planctomycetota bacterium]